MIREPGTLGGEAGKLPAHLPFLRLLLWEATQELEGLGRIREDKDNVCRQPQVWAGNHWPADSGRPQNWCSCSTWPPLSPSSLPGVRDCHAVWVGVVGGAGRGILTGRGGWYSTLRDGMREAYCRPRVTAGTNTRKPVPRSQIPLGQLPEVALARMPLHLSGSRVRLWGGGAL